MFDSVTPWTVARQAPLSMGFSRQEYWSRLPFPSPGDLPNPGIEPQSPALQADALSSEPPGKLVTTNKTPIIDTQKLRRKKHKHTTKNHQITKVETKRRANKQKNFKTTRKQVIK